MSWNNEDCYNEGVKDGENAARKEYDKFWLKRLKDLKEEIVAVGSPIMSINIVHIKFNEWIDEIENSD